VQSRSFPLFVALSLRWVAGAWTPPETFAVGEPVDLDDVELEDPRQRAVASLGDSFTPTSPGVHALANGQRVAAALLDPDTSVPPVSSAALAVAAVGGGGLDFATLLLLIALLLLAAEWFLLQTGRLP
jgi:hypothetical protein